MSNAVVELLIISVICGAAISIIPEGGTKNISHILCTSILILSIFSFIGDLDFESINNTYPAAEREAAFCEEVETRTSRLGAAFMKNRYEEYILDKANEMGIEELIVNVEIYKVNDTENIPYSVELAGENIDTFKTDLGEIIAGELGIPEERQFWKYG